LDTPHHDVHNKGLMTGAVVSRRDGVGVTTLALKLAAVTEQPAMKRRPHPPAALRAGADVAAHKHAIRLLPTLRRDASAG
jgi:hypothetical protein